MTITENTESTTAESPPLTVEEQAIMIDVDRQAAETVAALILPDAQQPAPDTRLSTPNIDPYEIVRRIGLPVTVNERGRYACPVCNMDYEQPQALGPHFRLHWQEAGVTLRDIPSNKDARCICPECKMPLRRHSLIGHLRTRHDYDPAVATGVVRVYGFDLDAYLNPPPKVIEVERPKANVKLKHKVKYEDWQRQFVACPHDECGAVHRRKYMKRHIEAIHFVPGDEALAVTKALPATRHTKSIQSKLPNVKGRPAQSKALTSIEPDALTAPANTAPLFEGAPSGFDFTAISPTDIAIGVIQSQLNGTMPTAILPDVIVYVDHTRTLIDQLRATRGT